MFVEIDDGKVIHLVKRTAPPRSDTANTSAQSTSGANSNTTNSRRVQHQIFHGDSNPILMGTIAVEPGLSSSILNQMMRQLFEGQSSASNSAANVVGSDGRSRLNQIRRIHQFIRTSLSILESPHQFPLSLLQTLQSPSQNPVTDMPDPEQPVTANEYSALFQDTFNAFDRLRPHLNNFLGMLDNRRSTFSSPSIRDMQTNFSVLMRITHHLSHVLHLFTDFDVNLSDSNNPRLSLNVLRNSQQTQSETSANTSTGTSATSTASSTGPTITTPAGSEARSSTSSTTTTTTTSGPSMFVAQSPIVMMEVDSNDQMDGSNRGVGLNININGQAIAGDNIQSLVSNLTSTALGSLNNIMVEIPSRRTVHFSPSDDLNNFNLDSSMPLNVDAVAVALNAARSIASSIASNLTSLTTTAVSSSSTATNSSSGASTQATSAAPPSNSTSRGTTNSANMPRDSLVVFDSFLSW